MANYLYKVKLGKFAGADTDSFAPGQERVWRCCNFAGSETILDCEGQFVDHFPSVWRHDSSTDEDALFVGNEFDETIAKVASVAAGNERQGRDGFFDLEVAA